MYGYTGAMAKVMVSMPDELLAKVDALAERTGNSRSGVLRDFAETALNRQSNQLLEARRALLADSPSLIARRGGDVADVVKRSRP